MAKSNEMDNHTINLIGTGTTIDGNITSNGDIRIDGNLNGNLFTKGKVIVGDTGRVHGEVHCKNFEVEGSLEGKITVNELLSLRARSKVLGEISTSKLAIEPGAVFTGKCDMSGSSQNSNAAKPNESKEK